MSLEKLLLSLLFNGIFWSELSISTSDKIEQMLDMLDVIVIVMATQNFSSQNFSFLLFFSVSDRQMFKMKCEKMLTSLCLSLSLLLAICLT